MLFFALKEKLFWILLYDEQMYRAVYGLAWRWSVLDAVAIFFATYAIFALALLAFYSAQKKNIFLVASCLGAFVGNIIAGFIVLHDRVRPYIEFNVLPLINHHPDNNSFPSDHAALAFALATVIYLQNRRWGIYAYVFAGLIGFGRILVGVHYPGDVIVGAAIGIGVTALLHSFWGSRQSHI
jgi:undecaprenyl-diphosphatase